MGCRVGEGSKVTVDGEDFGEEVGGVDEAGKEDKTEELLAGSLLEPVETHVYRFGLLRPNRRSRRTDGALSTNRRMGDCWGWPRLVRASVSSTNTCPPPKAAAYSASATDATTTGMRWQ
jgi:hypothetical protein